MWNYTYTDAIPCSFIRLGWHNLRRQYNHTSTSRQVQQIYVSEMVSVNVSRCRNKLAQAPHVTDWILQPGVSVYSESSNTWWHPSWVVDCRACRYYIHSVWEE